MQQLAGLCAEHQLATRVVHIRRLQFANITWLVESDDIQLFPSMPTDGHIGMYFGRNAMVATRSSGVAQASVAVKRQILI